ncbi:MAG: hypothetical protein V1648_01015 [Candidatus Aenigmatarchaeota archaeon]
MDEDSNLTKDLTDKLSTLEDLQNLTQLDILNMKNEVEKLKLTSSSPLPKETEERIMMLQSIAKDVEMFKRWKQTVEEVKFLRDRLMGISPVNVTPEDAGDFEQMKRSIEEMRAEIASKKSAPIDLDDIKLAIQENRKAVENLKLMITDKPKGAMPDAEPLRKMVTENRRIVDDLKMKMDVSNFEVPAGMRRDIESLHAEINNLEGEVRKIKTDKIVPRSNDDMDHLRNELFSKLDDLNVKFGPKSSEEVKKAMEANKASIDKLKALISGEEMSIESLKQEMGENRKFMTEIKSVLLSKSATTGKKITLTQDPDIKTKLSKMEQRIEMLAARMEKLNDLKPIKLPDFEPSPAAAKGAKAMGQVKTSELDVLRREIDTIVSRMDGFMTKDDVEKGFLDKRMKADEKLMTGDIYKDLNEVKKAILRNEDHVNSVASDVERIKKEVGTVEKREWGKVSEIPSIDELKRRIEELEKRIEEVHEGPIFIE